MNSICAGIVLFNPDVARLQENVASACSQTEKVYLVDNGSDNIENIKFLFSKNEKIKIIENGINLGIAAALNKICASAKEDGFDWVVTLDQDSVLFDDAVSCFIPYTDTPKTAMLCPLIVDDYEKLLIRSEGLPETVDVDRCITSGCLTKIDVWDKIGGFDEAMFIDCVDFDYCTNAVINGYRIIKVNAARIHHRLGKAREIRFFVALGKILHSEKLKKNVFTYNHSPKRTYYYARNIHYYMKKYKGFIDMKKEKRAYFKWVVLKIFFEKQKFKKLLAIIKGTVDSKKLYRLYKIKEKCM